MFEITFDDVGVCERLATAPAVLARETTNWLVDMAMWAKADLKQRVPVKTGTLRNSVRYELSGGEATFYSVDYGKHVDEGLRPFTMRAPNGKPFAFSRGSDKIFAASIRHPGIKARNFTLETYAAAITEADRQADEIARRITEAIV